MNEELTVIEKVRRALGRTEPLKSPPVPPAIDEPIARLVATDIGLPELFQKNASDMKMKVYPTPVDELLEKVAAFLRECNCKSVVLPDSPFLQKLGVAKHLNDNGFVARLWSEVTLDQAYDFDAGLTDVYRAVAENGTLVLKFGPDHGRIISLAPFVHVAIVQPKNFLPDMIDLFELLATEDCANGVCLIAGPSKTADIEMNVVTGVHGPNVVAAFVLR